jgi:hypothetical protein
MKKLLILLTLTSAVFAGHWIYVTQPDGTVKSCFVEGEYVTCY